MTIETIVDGSGLTPEEDREWVDKKTQELRQRYSPHACDFGENGLSVYGCERYNEKSFCPMDCDYALYRRSIKGRVKTFFGLR